MSDIVIRTENLGKSYIIGHEKREKYTALRDVLANKARQIVSKTHQIFKGGQLIIGDELEEFWALKDINFEVKQGDRIGIIGRNGAGKSTLLKILSRITEPTTGRVTIRGRVASLLEVGTGFHPELTGRENIYLNGAILGMSQAEVKRKFDEIVDFSGVEKFLDTPVKRYSSGMYVRLAFAVAAHMEPEILVVDEVLAVGDAEFQKKCLGKMEDVSAKEGRTVLFVSHNMGAVQKLCGLGILLDKGRIKSKGEINDVLNSYLLTKFTNNSIFNFSHKPELPVFATQLSISDVDNNLQDEIPFGQPWVVRIKINVTEDIDNIVIGLGLTTEMDVPIRTSWQEPKSYVKGNYIAVFIEDNVLLGSGGYKLLVGISYGGTQTIQYIDDNIYFRISDVTHKKVENVIRTKGIIVNQMKMYVEKYN
jgi:lipopolysaccharide transport system ATP-binding protein